MAAARITGADLYLIRRNGAQAHHQSARHEHCRNAEISHTYLPLQEIEISSELPEADVT